MEIKININVCRVCLKPPVEPVSLFHHDGSLSPASETGAASASLGVLARQFTAVTQLEVNQHDGLPTTLCAKCVTRLRIGYSFRTQTHESDAYLKSFICKVKNEFQTGTTVRAAQQQQLDQSSSAMEVELLRENGFEPASTPNTAASSTAASPMGGNGMVCDQLQKSMHEDLMEDVSEAIEQLEKSASSHGHSGNSLNSNGQESNSGSLSDSGLVVCGLMVNSQGQLTGRRRQRGNSSVRSNGNESGVGSVCGGSISGASIGGGSATGSSIMGDITDTFDEDIDEEQELEEQSAEDEDTTDMLVEEIIFSENAKLELENFQSFSDLTETLKKAEKQHHQQQQQQLELHGIGGESPIKVIYINNCDDAQQQAPQLEMGRKSGGRRVHLNGSLVPSLNGGGGSSDSGLSSNGSSGGGGGGGMHSSTGSSSSSSMNTRSGGSGGTSNGHNGKSGSLDRFQCQKCDKQFHSATNLMRHQRMHETKKTFQCQHCDKTFTQKGSLKQHSYIHTGERPFKCDICEKTFTQSKSLKFHLRCHTGEKPYECEYCQLRFSQKDSLKRHVNTFHKLDSAPEEYKCEYCGRILHTKHSYAVHVKKHTNGSQFQCDICNKVLSTKSILENHRRNHMSETTTYKCGDCGLGFATKGGLQQHQKAHQQQQQQQQNQFQSQSLGGLSGLGGGDGGMIDVKPTFLSRSPDHHRVPTHNTILTAVTADHKPPILLTQPHSLGGQNHHRMGGTMSIGGGGGQSAAAAAAAHQCYRCMAAFDSQKALQIHLRTEHRGDVSPQTAFAPMSVASLPMQPMLMRSSPPHGVCSSPPQQMAQHPSPQQQHGMSIQQSLLGAHQQQLGGGGCHQAQQQQQNHHHNTNSCNSNSSCSNSGSQMTGCGNCKLTFVADVKQQQQHENSQFHDAMEETQCAYCDSKFTSQKLFQEHQALEHKIPPMADTDKLIHHGYGDI